jgi:hypothetical protein
MSIAFPTRYPTPITNADDCSADPADLSQGNWGVWAFRGKRYEAMARDET